MGFLLFGALLMLLWSRGNPGFFRGKPETFDGLPEPHVSPAPAAVNLTLAGR